MKIFFIHSLKLALVPAKAHAIIVLIAIIICGMSVGAGAKENMHFNTNLKLKIKSDQNAMSQVIEGIVTDEKNEPLPGVSIFIKGTTNGTVTDAKGRFKITADPGNVSKVTD